MVEVKDRIKTAEDFVRSVVEKTFGQRVDDESIRLAAEKIARNLPAKPESKKAA